LELQREILEVIIMSLLSQLNTVGKETYYINLNSDFLWGTQNRAYKEKFNFQYQASKCKKSRNYSGTLNEPNDLDFDIWGYLIANA
jgi:hypothetical protein